MSEDFAVQLAGLQVGSLLAGYTLEAQVGAGGMAVVFRARDERLGRLVALKVLAPGFATDPGFRRRFIAESRAAAAVDHPHIIPIYEAGEADGALFIAMRFVGGGDLRRILDREGALPPGRVVPFISPVASALDAAHAVGLVHRDVKPANILVDTRQDRSDHVYLSDFGVSKGAISSVSLTGEGHFVGTPTYAAPEQIQGLAVDGRADQYALACVAFQMLAGVPPFGRDQEMAVLFAHLSEPPPSVVSRRPSLSAAVDAVLARGMAKVPEKRFESCAEFAGALRGALGLAPYTAARFVSGRPPSPVAAARSLVKPPWPDGSTGAATIDSVPDGARAAVRIGPGHARSRPPAPRPRWRRLLPLTAAAVIIIAVAVLAAITHPKLGSGASATRGPTKVVYVDGGRVPPYYVWISSRGNPYYSPRYAAVRLTATGAVLGAVTAAVPGNTVVAVTGAADDRTFVLDEQPWVSLRTGGSQLLAPHTFYLLRLSVSGKPELVTRLPISVPSGEAVSGPTLSPDGTKLAIAISPNPNNAFTVLKLYSVPAGKVLRTWYAHGSITESDDPEALSWTSSQRMLAFSWAANGAATQQSASQQGEWLLDLGKAGTSLLGNSRFVLPNSSSTSPLACGTDTIITPNGSEHRLRGERRLQCRVRGVLDDDGEAGAGLGRMAHPTQLSIRRSSVVQPVRQRSYRYDTSRQRSYRYDTRGPSRHNHRWHVHCAAGTTR